MTENSQVTAEEKKSNCKGIVGMLIIGTLNNFPYWVALSSAQTIVNHFDSAGLLGVITWGCVLFGVFATSINTLLSSKGISYVARAIVNGCFMTFGLIGAAFSPNIYVAIPCIAFVGLSSDFGEGVMLGYFALNHDNSLLNAWGIGTGISGMLGSGYSFLCDMVGIPYFTSFLALSPAGIIYPLAFYFLLDHSTKKEKDKEIELEDQVDKDEAEVTQIEEADVSVITDIEKNQQAKEADIENIPFCSCRVWKMALWFFLNNGATFFSQYVSISCFNDCAMTQEEKKKLPWVYSMCNLCYQVGNAIGRSTLRIKKSPYILAHTIIQFVFFIYMLINVFFIFTPIWGMAIINFFVGLNGGLSYVNIFDQTMNLPTATKKEREIITNYTSISIAGFIIISSAFTLLMQNAAMNYECKVR